MTLAEIIQLLDAAGQVLSGAIKLAGEARATLSASDQADLAQRLASIRAQNEADFARVDAKLSAAAQA